MNIGFHFFKSKSISVIETGIIHVRNNSIGNYLEIGIPGSGGKRNSKFAIGAAINALARYQGEIGYSDFSNGANSWDGIDLISKKHTNFHRTYIWDLDSKDLIEKYRKDNNGGVNVGSWKYQKTGYQISVTARIGKTLFTYLSTGRGEKKTEATRFVIK